MTDPVYPDAVDPSLVGDYPAVAGAGGGYVWDAVLEYRVWCHPERGATDFHDGDDYYYAFVTYADALAFAVETVGAARPIALVQQLEYIDESEPGVYRHVTEPRIVEWSVEFLARPKRTAATIPAFLAADAPANRLDILRGLARPAARK